MSGSGSQVCRYAYFLRQLKIHNSLQQEVSVGGSHLARTCLILLGWWEESSRRADGEQRMKSIPECMYIKDEAFNCFWISSLFHLEPFHQMNLLQDSFHKSTQHTAVTFYKPQPEEFRLYKVNVWHQSLQKICSVTVMDRWGTELSVPTATHTLLTTAILLERYCLHVYIKYAFRNISLLEYWCLFWDETLKK